MNETPPRPVDHARIERAVREILAAVGEDPDREAPVFVYAVFASLLKVKLTYSTHVCHKPARLL